MTKSWTRWRRSQTKEKRIHFHLWLTDSLV